MVPMRGLGLSQGPEMNWFELLKTYRKATCGKRSQLEYALCFILMNHMQKRLGTTALDDIRK